MSERLGMQVVRFQLGTARAAFPVEQVREVVGLGQLATVFHAPAFVAGLMNVRGQAFPVLDLVPLLGLSGAGGEGTGNRGDGRPSHVLMVEAGELTAGILASRPVDIADVGVSEVPPAAGVPGLAALSCIASEDGVSLLVLDAGRLFDLPDVHSLRSGRRPLTLPG